MLEEFAVEGMESQEWGAVVDPIEFLRDDATFGYPTGQANLIRDKANGRNAPVYETEAQLAILRYIGRSIVAATETGRNVIDRLIDYVIGQGFTWKVEARPEAVVAIDDGTLGALQRVLDSILLKSRWKVGFDAEWLERFHRDGETIVGIFDGCDGVPELRFIEPPCVTEPPSTRELEEAFELPCGDWTFGVHTALDDVETVYGYFCQWSTGANDWDYLPASRVVHHRANVDRNVKRGVTSFYPGRNTVRIITKLIRNMGEGAALQSAIAWICEVGANASAAQVRALQNNNSGATTRALANGGSNQSASVRSITKYGPGSIITTKQGVQYKPGPMGAERNQGFVEVEQSLHRKIGMRFAFPEFLISGDASNGNYASLLAAESPFGRARQRDQIQFGEFWAECLRKALVVAIRSGVLERMGGAIDVDSFLAACTINYSAPPVQVRDESEQVTTAQGKLGLGISQETVLEELGYDPAIERQRGGMSSASVLGGLGAGDAGAVEPGGTRPTTDPSLTPAPVSAPEMSNLSRLQFGRNAKATDDVLAMLQAGASPVKVKTFLLALGWSEERADALIADASDGVIDDPANAAQESNRAPVRGVEAIESVSAIVSGVQNGTFPRDSGIAQLRVLCGLTEQQAVAVMGSAGSGDDAENGFLTRMLRKWWGPEQ